MYEEQLNAELQFPLDGFYKAIMKFHNVYVAQVHPNSWQTLVGLCWAKKLKPTMKVFAKLHGLAR